MIQFTTGRQGAMRKLLAACLFSLALVAGAAVQVSAQESAADKTKDAADKTVDTTKAVGSKVGDKTEDAADATAHGAKAAAHKTGDKAEDAKDATAHGAKKTGNWFKRTWHKIF